MTEVEVRSVEVGGLRLRAGLTWPGALSRVKRRGSSVKRRSFFFAVFAKFVSVFQKSYERGRVHAANATRVSVFFFGISYSGFCRRCYDMGNTTLRRPSKMSRSKDCLQSVRINCDRVSIVFRVVSGGNNESLYYEAIRLCFLWAMFSFAVAVRLYWVFSIHRRRRDSATYRELAVFSVFTWHTNFVAFDRARVFITVILTIPSCGGSRFCSAVWFTPALKPSDLRGGYAINRSICEHRFPAFRGCTVLLSHQDGNQRNLDICPGPANRRSWAL
jgi:hypothetical protein